jgi:hypothetical protein
MYKEEQIKCEVCKNRQSEYLYYADNMEDIHMCAKCIRSLSKDYRKEYNTTKNTPVSNPQFMKYASRRIKEINREYKIENILHD